MAIKYMAYCPHPPIVVPEVGGERRNEAKKTVTAMEKLVQELASENQDIETIICITSHGPIFQDAITLWRTPVIVGDLGKFGAKKVSMSFENDLELGLEIIKEAVRKKIVTAQLDERLIKNFQIDPALDHGVLVPLTFFPKLIDKKTKLVVISIGLLSTEELYQYGMAIADAIEKSKRQVGIIVSGDLSHRVTKDAPGGFHPKGREFDEKVVTLLEQSEVVQLASLEEKLIEAAGECGYRPLMIGLGILENFKFATRILSYEAPFGVGYLVARLEITGENHEDRYQQIVTSKKNKLETLKENESPPVKLARHTVEQLVNKREKTATLELIPGLEKPKGVFVSIKKKGQLRGCIGTVEPEQENVTSEIAANAKKAAFNDPRFEPVTQDELGELEYSVDVLEPPEPVPSEAELNPRVYGVVVTAGRKKGLLLPDLPGVDTAAQQVAIAKQKAGVGPGEKVQLYRFKVIRYI